ncbi:MAG TPA: hypothetical protein VF509_08715 [Sphingobium sp.]
MAIFAAELPLVVFLLPFVDAVRRPPKRMGACRYAHAGRGP